MIYHNIVIDLSSNSTEGVVDIIEGNQGSHEVRIQLKGKVCYSDLLGTPVISYVVKDPETQEDVTIVSKSAKVINPCRGIVSWVVEDRLLQDFGRHTVVLSFSKERVDEKVSPDREPKVVISCTFIVNVAKRPEQTTDPSEVEVSITQEFYEKLEKLVIEDEKPLIYLGIFSEDSLPEIDDKILETLSKSHYSEEGYNLQLYPGPCKIVIVSQDYEELTVSDTDIEIEKFQIETKQGACNVWILQYDKEIYKILKILLK